MSTQTQNGKTKKKVTVTMEFYLDGFDGTKSFVADQIRTFLKGLRYGPSPVDNAKITFISATEVISIEEYRDEFTP